METLGTTGAGNELYRAAFDYASDGMLLANEEGRIVAVNRAAQRLLERPEQDLLDQSVETLQAPDVDIVRAESGVYCVRPREKTPSETLDATERELRLITDDLPSLVSYVDRDLRYRFANRTYERWFGVPRERIVGATVAELLGPAYPNVVPMMEKALAGEFAEKEIAMPYPKGERIVQIQMVPDVGPDGISRGFVAQVTDVTEERRAQAARRIGEERFRVAAESSSDCIFLFDAVRNDAGEIVDFRFVEVNERGAALLGFPKETLLGANMCEILPRNREMGFFDRYKRVLETGEPLEEEFGECAAGHVDAWFQQQTVPLVNGIAITVRDMTASKKMLEALTQSEARFRGVVESNVVGVMFWRTSGELYDANQAACDMLGYTQEEFQSGQIRWQEITPPEWASVDAQMYPRLVEDGRTPIFEKEYFRKDGSRLPIEIVGARLPDHEGGVIIFTDISRRKAAEAQREALNAELEARVKERNHELEVAVHELEGFTYSVSHDLRAPLRAISASSHMLMEDHLAEFSDEARTLLLKQARSAERLGTLIDDLLRLSRITRHEIQRADVDLSALFEEVGREALRSTMVPIRLVVEKGVRAVADPVLIRFVIQNLLENAVKFSPNGGEIRFGRRQDGAFFVADQGIGFDPQYASKLFLPFERLVSERDFPGTGIGLANVFRIVTRHGGAVWAEGELGHGATFYFTLGQPS